MTAPGLEVPDVVATAPAPEHGLPDFLNPIFVREIQQSMKSRAFSFTMLLALGAVVVIAILVAADPGANGVTGRHAFQGTLLVMAPILLVVVPLQAFHAASQEMRGGTAELLLLSSLTPWRIVRGKVFAGLAHFLLYLAVFAPLVAMTFLLRGVDVPTIAMTLSLATLACVLACLLAIGLGTLARWRPVASLINVVAALALVGLALPAMGLTSVLRLGIFGRMTSSVRLQVLIGLLLVATTLGALFAMIAVSQLTHDNENRSTPFRVLAVAVVAGMFTWTWLVVPASTLAVAFPSTATACLLVGSPFFLFAVTEEAKLSPRVRTLVPKGARRALLAAPFLPGGGRGLLFGALVSAAVVTTGLTVPLLAAGADVTLEMLIPVLAALHVLFYAALGRLIRSRLGPGPAGTWVARLLLVLSLASACVLPLLVDALSGGRSEWNAVHVLSPFSVMHLVRIAGSMTTGWTGLSEPMTLIVGLYVVMLLANRRVMAAGVAEVLEASRAPRRTPAPARAEIVPHAS